MCFSHKFIRSNETVIQLDLSRSDRNVKLAKLLLKFLPGGNLVLMLRNKESSRHTDSGNKNK
jgi:hypothetical protein